MARPPLRAYEGGAGPRSSGITPARNVDLGGPSNAIGQALARAGRTVDAIAEQDLQIEIMNRAREEDDARVYTAQQMAEVRRRSNELRRNVFTNAVDGWRDATTGVATGYSQIRDEAITNAPTPAAREFMHRSLSLFEQELLDSSAEQENTSRQQWRVDGVTAAIDTASSVLAADPGQYDAVRGEQVELIQTMTDLTPDQRRDLTSRAEESLALSTGSGLVERDPMLALSILRDPDAGGWAEHINGQQRNQLERRAQDELNSRAARAREGRNQAIASLRDAVSAQRDNMRRTGVPPNQPLDIGQIATLLGPDVAQAYLGDLQGVSVSQQVAGWPMDVVAEAAAGRVVAHEGEDIERLLNAETRSSAAASLDARAQDPGNFALRNGLMRHGNLMTALAVAAESRGPASAEAWAAVDAALMDRAADAVALRDRRVVPRVAPLSTEEARALGSLLRERSLQSRLAFFSRAASAMNREAYTAMMTQIAPDGGEVMAYAGARFPENPTVARRLLRGSELLQGAATTGGDAQRRPTIDMPSETELHRAWEDHVGEAYEGLPGAQQGAYAAYRAYYAAMAEEDGDTSSDELNLDRAQEAVGAATGGVVEWANRPTLMPPGMRADDFAPAVQRAFDRHVFLNHGRNDSPGDYQLRALSGGRYQVYDGDTPLREPGRNGRTVIIQLERPSR